VAPVTGNRVQNRTAANRTADASAASVPRIPDPGVQPGVIRTHVTIAPDDVLRSLGEKEERDRQVLAERESAEAGTRRDDSTNTLMLVNKKSVPYDPQPVRRPILDILA
jgi:hypothetical protein